MYETVMTQPSLKEDPFKFSLATAASWGLSYKIWAILTG